MCSADSTARSFARPADTDADVPVATRQRPSRRSVAARILFRVAVRPLFRFGKPEGGTLSAIRFVTDRATGSARRIPHRTWTTTLNGVPSTWVQAHEAADTTTVLHLHGGGFMTGSPRSHTALAARLSAACDAGVCLPDYRLSPEHPHPAGADDALAAYRGLLATGIDPARLVVSGDSAGGHLAACLINDLLHQRLPLPAAVVLLSPVIDPTATRATARDLRRRDPVLAVPFWLPAIRAHFRAASPRDERVTPIDGVDRRWPPTLVQVGTRECLLDDARAFDAALKQAGVPSELQVWPGQVHVFQTLAGLVPEAGAAIDEIGRFLRRPHAAA